jgi:hypothetical protein
MLRLVRAALAAAACVSQLLERAALAALHVQAADGRSLHTSLQLRRSVAQS